MSRNEWKKNEVKRSRRNNYGEDHYCRHSGFNKGKIIDNVKKVFFKKKKMKINIKEKRKINN